MTIIPKKLIKKKKNLLSSSFQTGQRLLEDPLDSLRHLRTYYARIDESINGSMTLFTFLPKLLQLLRIYEARGVFQILYLSSFVFDVVLVLTNVPLEPGRLGPILLLGDVPDGPSDTQLLEPYLRFIQLPLT